MSGGDHVTPIPALRKPRIPILSGRGAAYFALRSGWRYFVTGREIIGAGDNATWLHDATEDYRHRPYVKLTRARWRRVARRWAVAGIPGGLIVAEGASRVVGIFPDAPGWTEIPWWELLEGYAVTGPLAAGALCYPRAKAWFDTREIRREVVYPATKVACQILGQRWDRRLAATMLELPPGFGEPTEDGDQPSVRLYVPPVPLDPNTKKRITSNVGARLGLPDATGEWQEFGGKAWVQLSGADVPPKTVDLSGAYEDTTLRKAIETSELTRPVMGVARGGRIIRADMDNDSPHVAASGASGTGKSTLWRLFLAQRLRHGTGALILDLKGISHPWAYRLPRTRVLYFHKIEDIHDALVAVGAELYERRERSVAALRAGAEPPDFRVLDVVVEEAPSLIAELSAYWTARRKDIQRENKLALELDPYADVTEPPARSPAVDAAGFLINMGRELRMHAHYLAQRLDASVFGGQGAQRRNSFQDRYLAKWDRATWRMLADGIPYRVCPNGPRGIWARVSGGQVDIMRVPELSTDMVVDMVLDSPDPGTPVLPALSGGHVRTIEGETVQADRLESVRGQRVELSGAADMLGMTLSALRQASHRPGFPEPLAETGSHGARLYDMAELIEWREQRAGALLKV